LNRRVRSSAVPYARGGFRRNYGGFRRNYGGYFRKDLLRFARGYARVGGAFDGVKLRRENP